MATQPIFTNLKINLYKCIYTVLIKMLQVSVEQIQENIRQAFDA